MIIQETRTYELDDNIALLVLELNRKGYITDDTYNEISDFIEFLNEIKDYMQKYLLKFCNAYDTSLNKNSKPLFDLFKKLDNIEKIKNMNLSQKKIVCLIR